MHEISLCEDVLVLIEAQSREQRFSKVDTVWLEIGALACVEKDAMRAGFESVSKGSVAEGARLEIIGIEGRALCPRCKREVGIAARFDGCPLCGHYPLDIVAGEELRISELEVR
jgi:hydrogenase nickel incorporation protein HypA/HybF